MGTAIGEMLPLAIGIAISPTTITATVLMLLSNAKSRTVALLLGCLVGVGGAVALSSCAVDAVADPRFRRALAGGRGHQTCGRCALLGVGGESMAAAARDRRAGRAAEMDDGC